jgi:hypothetical protein
LWDTQDSNEYGAFHTMDEELEMDAMNYVDNMDMAQPNAQPYDVHTAYTVKSAVDIHN